MRLFVAAVIPDFALKKIITVQESLRTGFGTSVRWTNPSAIHLTLKFLGEIPESKKPAIWKMVETISKNETIYPVECSKIGVFPNFRSPKVVWLGLNIPPALRWLQNEMNKRLESLGVIKEEREFSPHLTLGRVGTTLRNHEMSFLKEQIAWYSNKTITTFDINLISLIKSDLQPTGPIYTVLNSVILRTVE